MYESHFGLTFKPFGSKAEGPAVFVGPRQAEAISAIHKGLAASDAVVTVTGTVGVGKTSVVNRALDTIHPGRMAAWVGRMAISSEEVLELLLAGFGFKRKTSSTLQRFAAFRRLMHERAATGIPVAIVIEDAKKLGVAALAEVEALTAADTADGSGANIILMGDSSLDELLSDPELARLKQRIRRRQRVEPLSEAEVRGYLKHAIRTAEGDYDNLFGPGVAEIVAACSEGVPRLVNTLCETALASAMEDGKDFVSAEFMHQVAADAFGYDGELPLATASAPEPVKADPASDIADAAPQVENAADALSAQVAAPDPVTPCPVDDVEEDDIPESARNIIVESGRYPLEPDDEPEPELQASTPAEPEPEPEPVPAPELLATEDTASHQPASPIIEEELLVADDEPTLTDIPELINDTQPDLDVLPASAAVAETQEDPETEFDLDAALSPDVEATNMMPGVTPNLDAIASTAGKTNRMPAITEKLDEIAAYGHAGRSAESVEPAFNPDDLPTLSDSMRVELKKEAADAVAEPDAEDRAPQADDSTDAENGPDVAAEAQAAEQNSASPPNENVVEVPFDLDSALELEQESPASESPGKPAEPSFQDVNDEPQPGPEIEPEPQAVFDTEPELPADVEDEPAAAAQEPAEETPSSEIAATEPPEDNAPVMADPLTDSTPVIPEADLTALQAALDAVKGGDVGGEDILANTPEPPANDAEEAVPDITLDQVIAEQQSKNEELEKFAAAIGEADSLEEISDVMAETLFGEEFDEAAAAAIAMGADAEVAEGELVVPGASNDDTGNGSENGSDPEPVAETSAELAAENSAEPDDKAAAEVPEGNELRQSVAMRIDVLNQMKDQIGSERTENVEMGEETPHVPAPPNNGAQPEPIERQINTTMTQTLEALNVAKAAEAASAEKAEKKSGGFFARFRRSS